MIKDGVVSNCQFNAYLDEFNELLLRNLNLIKSEASDTKFEIINNYKKELNIFDKCKTKAYTLTRIRISGSCLIKRLLIDFTVSYDNFYLVPVLYFRAFEDTKQNTKEDKFEPKVTPIISFEELVSNYSSFLGIKNGLDLSSTITLDSHHLISDSCIWFYVHPCETLATLRDFIVVENYISPTDTERSQVLKYLSSWFGTYGISGVFPSLSFRPTLHVN